MSSSAARARRFPVGAGLARTLGSAVATSWFIEAFMGTAEYQRPALIEAQDMKTLRSGCLDE
jgi:hypothetical protein